MLVWAHWVGWRKSSEVCFAGERLIKARPMAYSYILVRRMYAVALSETPDERSSSILFGLSWGPYTTAPWNAPGHTGWEL